MAEELNPFKIAQAQLDGAAKKMRLKKSMHEYLREPQRFLQVRIPVKMDNGSTRTFTGFRCRTDASAGKQPGKQACRMRIKPLAPLLLDTKELIR